MTHHHRYHHRAQALSIVPGEVLAGLFITITTHYKYAYCTCSIYHMSKHIYSRFLNRQLSYPVKNFSIVKCKIRLLVTCACGFRNQVLIAYIYNIFSLNPWVSLNVNKCNMYICEVNTRSCFQSSIVFPHCVKEISCDMRSIPISALCSNPFRIVSLRKHGCTFMNICTYITNPPKHRGFMRELRITFVGESWIIFLRYFEKVLY